MHDLSCWKSKKINNLVNNSLSVSPVRRLLVFPLILRNIYLNQPAHYALLNSTAEIDLQTFTKEVAGTVREEDVSTSTVINMTGLEVESRLMQHSLFPTVH